jgi:hypothetical protein
MKPLTRRLIGAINFAEAVVTLIGLVAAYGIAERLVAAQESVGPSGIATRTVHWWGPDFTVTLNMSLLIVGAAAGAVGSVIHQSMVFAQRAGTETLERGFVWWYLLRPTQRATATQAGNYSYVVDAAIRWYDDTGTEQVTETTGRGSIAIHDGMRVGVYLHQETDGVSLSLQSATE